MRRKRSTWQQVTYEVKRKLLDCRRTTTRQPQSGDSRCCSKHLKEPMPGRLPFVKCSCITESKRPLSFGLCVTAALDEVSTHIMRARIATSLTNNYIHGMRPLVGQVVAVSV